MNNKENTENRVLYDHSRWSSATTARVPPRSRSTEPITTVNSDWKSHRKQIRMLRRVASADPQTWNHQHLVTNQRLITYEMHEGEREILNFLLSLLPAFFQTLWEDTQAWEKDCYVVEDQFDVLPQYSSQEQTMVEAEIMTEERKIECLKLGQKVIFYARKGDYLLLSSLLDANFSMKESIKIILQCKDQKQRGTALNWAANQGNLRCVEKLLQVGATVDQIDKRGGTALSYAAANGHARVVAALMEAGAESGRQDSHGSTALHYAAGFGHAEVLDVLLEGGTDHSLHDDKGMQALHWAAKQGHSEAVDSLVAHGASLCAQDPKGRTPLSLACASGHTRCARMLFTWDTVEIEDHKGVTPLSFCASLGHLNCAAFLIEARADVNHEDSAKISPLSWAASHNHLQCAQLLLRHGANIDSMDKSGVTALSWASSKGHSAVVGALLEHLAHVDLPDCRGMTPLMWAATHGKQANVELLLAAGADPSICDKRHKSNSLHEAAFRNHTGIVRMLLACPKTNKNARNGKGKVAAALATSDECKALFKK